MAGVLALLLALLANDSSGAGALGGWVARLMAPLLWSVRWVALLAVRPDYRRAALAPTLNALMVMTVLAGPAAVARAADWAPVAWLLADGPALMFLLVAGFAALLDVDLRVSSQRELLITALLLMLAFGVGATALIVSVQFGSPIYRSSSPRRPTSARWRWLLFPHLFDLRDSRLIWSWALLWLAALIQTTAYVADIARARLFFDVLAAGQAATWLVYLATLRRSRLTRSIGRMRPASARNNGSRAHFSSATPAATGCCAPSMAHVVNRA